MKIIRNTSMQGLSIPFGTPEGVKTIFVGPKKQIEVPDNWKSKVVENLIHRRMVRMTLRTEPQPVAPTPKVRKPRIKKPLESE